MFNTDLEHKISVILTDIATQNATNISKEHLKTVVHGISKKLDDSIFKTNDIHVKNDIAELIAKEYILFQLEENSEKDPDFKNLLENFIYSTAININSHYHNKGNI